MRILQGPAIAILLGALMACGRSQLTSPAADEIIATAENDEEREGLTLARDDIDDEMRRAAAEKDALIERLRKENEELRRDLDK